MPVGCYPDNHCGRYFQARCRCGWRGRRRWIFKTLILFDYEQHCSDWRDRVISHVRVR